MIGMFWQLIMGIKVAWWERTFADLVLNLCALLTMKRLPVNCQAWFITSISHVWVTTLPSPQFQLLHHWITYNEVSLLTEWSPLFFPLGSGCVGGHLVWLVNSMAFGWIMECVYVSRAFLFCRSCRVVFSTGLGVHLVSILLELKMVIVFSKLLFFFFFC